MARDRWSPVPCAALAVLAACSTPGQVRSGALPLAAAPNVRQALEWRMLWAVGALQGIARAPSGDYWAAGGDVATLSRFTPSGKLTTYRLGYVPSEIASDRSGNLWFTNARLLDRIVRFDPRTASVTGFALSDEAYGGVTLGGDGNVWFTEQTHIGKITPRGELTEYPTRMTEGASGLSWSGSGLVWFAARARQGYVLASLNSATGAVKLHHAKLTSSAGSILAGPKRFVWYLITGRPDVLVRFDSMTERVTHYSAPRDFTASPCPSAIALSPDGSIWYATQRLRGQGFEKHVVGGGYVRFDVKTRHFTAYPSPNGYDWNCDLVLGSRGEVWATAGPGISVLYRK
jgi:streptogramin lyase